MANRPTTPLWRRYERVRCIDVTAHSCERVASPHYCWVLSKCQGESLEFLLGVWAGVRRRTIRLMAGPSRAQARVGRPLRPVLLPLEGREFPKPDDLQW